MKQVRRSTLMYQARFIVAALLLSLAISSSAYAITPLPNPEPQIGSYGLEAVKKQPPPTTGARITTPGNGASFSKSPIKVSGICPKDLLVQILNNGVMAGSIPCKNGSFQIEVSLYTGTNELSALVYDSADQPGPVSNTVKVNYKNSSFSSFGEEITLTSAYARRSVSVGNPLKWPLQLSGGTGPYAFSIDWGDGTKPELKSQPIGGTITIAHVYERAGIYQVNIQVTDVNGVTAFLQVVAVANGKAATVANGEGSLENKATTGPRVMWGPTAASIALLIPSFWLGRMSQMVSIRNKMLKDRDAYNQK